MAKRKALIAVERQKTVPMTSNNSASTSLRGRRTGVIFSSQDDAPLRVDSDGMENADAFFESARTPPAIAVTRKEKENRPQKHLRFSLDSHGTSGSHGFFDKGALRRSQATRRREQWSPSELSKVSTAPPSVDRTREAAVLEEDVEQTRKGDDLDDEEGADAVFENRHAPGSPGANDLVVTNDPFDDDGDDMIPDPPPDSPTPDDDLTQEDDHMEAPTQNESDFPVDMDDDDDLVDDDNEGDGFQMAGSPVPETPDNALTERRLVEEKRLKKKRKEEKKLAAMKALNPANKSSSEADSDDQDAKTPKRKTKRQKKKTSRNAVFSPKGIPTGPREYNAVPVSELKQSPPAEAKKWRRSRRARTKPLDFWKNERIVYGPNDFDDDEYVGVKNMPVPIAFSLAQPTPYKKRKAPVWIDSDKAIALKKHRVAESSAVSIEEEPFDSSKLRKKYDYMNGQDANLWDDGTHEQVFTKAVAFHDELEERKLPLSKLRAKSDGKVVGRAAQAFNIHTEGDYVGYIMGNLTLPPKAIKDPESVGPCAQTFTVVSGQKGAIEIAYGAPSEEEGLLDDQTAQRFLLGPRDMFRIPPGNCYRLQNHSKTSECYMTWTIIRAPVNPAESP